MSSWPFLSPRSLSNTLVSLGKSDGVERSKHSRACDGWQEGQSQAEVQGAGSGAASWDLLPIAQGCGSHQSSGADGAVPPSLLAGMTGPIPWLVLLPCCFPGVQGGKQRRRVAPASQMGSEAVFGETRAVF